MSYSQFTLSINKKMISISNELSSLSRTIELKYNKLLALVELVKSRFICQGATPC